MAILFLLAEEPANGYGLIQRLEDKTGGRWRPSPGAVYPALSQLEDEGLIEPVDHEGRKAFAVTPAGREHVEAAADRPRPWEAYVDDDPHTARLDETWNALRVLGLATQAVVAAGDDRLAQAATEVLDDARRALYRLLADDAGEAGDVAAADGSPDADA